MYHCINCGELVDGEGFGLCKACTLLALELGGLPIDEDIEEDEDAGTADELLDNLYEDEWVPPDIKMLYDDIIEADDDAYEDFCDGLGD